MSLNLVTQLFVDGAWTTYPGYSADGWEVQIGPDVETGLRPNSVSVTLNNDDLSMDPTNVRSALYGKIGRNTKTRILINGQTVTQAEASSWQPDATVEHVPGAGRGKSWVDLQAEGLQRRLGRWEDPLRSAMARQILSYTSLVGYWTLEDDSKSSQLSNEVAGGAPGIFGGTLTLQGDDGAGGSDKSVEMGSDGFLGGAFKTTPGNGYQISWAAKLSAIPGSSTYQPMMSWADTQARRWTWSVNNTTHQVAIVSSDGTAVASFAFNFATVLPTQWTRYRVKVSVSGSTVTYEPAVYLQDAITSAGVTDTFSSTAAGRPVSWRATGNAWTDGAAYGHVLAVTDTSLNLLTGDAAKSFNGYLGEVSWSRYYRIMGEEGLVRYVNGDFNHCVPMGRQKPGKLLDLVEECVRTEAGLVHDEPVDIALSFLPYRALVNRTPALALTKAQIAAPLRKTVDDVGVVNDVTVRNSDGSTARVALDAGTLSTAPPPAGVGRVKGTVDVNMAEVGELGDRANWEMRKGTLDRPRYLSVSVNLLANPSLTNTVTSMRPGDWITLSGVEPDTVTLRVISINRKGDAVEDTVTFNCLPAELYQVGVYGATSSRYDSPSTTLAAAITTTTQTSLSLTTAEYTERWSSTAVPYDIRIGGERMTVTAMTAGTGTGPVTQTATVTRAVNGVQKLHAAGAEVHLFTQVRYALR